MPWFLGGASWGANLPEKLSFVIWEVLLLCDQISVYGWNGRLISIFHMFVIDRSSLEILVLFCRKPSIIWFPWTWTWYIMYVLPILWVFQFDQICKHFSWCFAQPTLWHERIPEMRPFFRISWLLSYPYKYTPSDPSNLPSSTIIVNRTSCEVSLRTRQHCFRTCYWF